MNLIPAMAISLATPLMAVIVIDVIVYQRLVRLFFTHRLWKGEVDPDDIIFDTFDNPVIKIDDKYGIAMRREIAQVVDERIDHIPFVHGCVYGPVYAGANNIFFAPSSIIQKKIEAVYSPILDDIERMNNL